MFIFLNTFKYVSAHETITLINASIILKKEEYEYSTTSQTKYKICATFSTASNKEKDPYRYYDEKFEHPKGRHCFDLEIPSYSIKNQSTSRTSTKKTTTFQDENIKSVTSDA